MALLTLAINVKQKLIRFISWLEQLERWHRVFVWTSDIFIFLLSPVAAFFVRFDFAIPREELGHLAYALPIWAATKIVVFRLMRLDRGWWRFVSIYDVVGLGAANIAGSLIGAFLILLLAAQGFPRSIYLLDFLICFLGTVGMRVAVRFLADLSVENGHAALRKNVVIYGAGTAGVMLLREARANPALRYQVAGFIDDNPKKRGVHIQGVKVLGAGEDLSKTVQSHGIEEVLIALPSATGAEMALILKRCQQAGVRCRTIPALAGIIQGRGLASQIRDVDVEDLLGRSPVNLEKEAILGKLIGNVVLVTGAGGSIGSELCRQIAQFQPKVIIGFEISENAIFHLDRFMKEAFPDVTFVPEVGSIQNDRRFSEVLRRASAIHRLSRGCLQTRAADGTTHL